MIENRPISNFPIPFCLNLWYRYCYIPFVDNFRCRDSQRSTHDANPLTFMARGSIFHQSKIDFSERR